jgi:hypothetical protein
MGGTEAAKKVFGKLIKSNNINLIDNIDHGHIKCRQM